MKTVFLLIIILVSFGESNLTAAQILLVEYPVSGGGIYGDSQMAQSIVGAQFTIGHDPIIQPGGASLQLIEENLLNSIGGTLRLSNGQTGVFDFNADNSPPFNAVVNKMTNRIGDQLYIPAVCYNAARKLTGGGGSGGWDLVPRLKGSKIDFFRLLVKQLSWFKNSNNSSQIVMEAVWQIYGTPLPYAATANASVVNGFVISVSVEGGYGYLVAPTVRINGGGIGSGATAEAIVENGSVTTIRVTNAGSGYKTPTVEIDPPPQPPELPRRAVAEAIVINGFVVSVRILDEGFGYVDAPSVSLIGGGGSGAVVSSDVNNGRVTGFRVLNAGNGYLTPLSVTISPPPIGPELQIAVSRVKVNMKLTVGKKYILEASKDFQTWTAAAPKFTADRNEIELEFEVQNTGQFFRIKELQ